MLIFWLMYVEQAKELTTQRRAYVSKQSSFFVTVKSPDILSIYKGAARGLDHTHIDSDLASPRSGNMFQSGLMSPVFPVQSIPMP